MRDTSWILKHRRLIYGQARKYYRAVPARHKCWLDVEDLYMLALAHVLTNADKYNSRWAETTFVQVVSARKLQDYLTRLNQGRRDESKTFALGDSIVEPSTLCKFFGDADHERRVLAFFQIASEAATKYVLHILLTGTKKAGKVPADLIWAYERSGVKAEDFLRCQAALV